MLGLFSKGGQWEAEDHFGLLDPFEHKPHGCLDVAFAFGVLLKQTHKQCILAYPILVCRLGGKGEPKGPPKPVWIFSLGGVSDTT